MGVSRILAVDPGRTTIGVAVFEGAALRYYAVKTLKVPGTAEAVRQAASCVTGRLINTYRPSYLAIEQPLVVQQRAELLAHVIRAIKSTARRHGLIVREYAPQAVRRSICISNKPTKREVSQRLAAYYPELMRYCSPGSKGVELYFEKIFGAVAVGVIASNLQGQL